MTKTMVLALTLLAGCGGGGPTAEAVCKKIEAAGLATGCKETKPGGLGATSDSTWVADLPSVPGKTVQVMHLPSDDTFNQTTKGYEGAAVLAGPHRYGNAGKRIFVQANKDLSLEDGKKLKALVDGL